MFRVPVDPDRPSYDHTFTVTFRQWLTSRRPERMEWVRRRKIAWKAQQQPAAGQAPPMPPTQPLPPGHYRTAPPPAAAPYPARQPQGPAHYPPLPPPYVPPGIPGGRAVRRLARLNDWLQLIGLSVQLLVWVVFMLAIVACCGWAAWTSVT
ncbi:hypothetical protein [Micromonospora thermarum]|uniref:Uncharacterized protein n=1 Tax=Micromonospora thermarum TaxID=2720024 RepID=A0ABX0Z9Q0_9ACTN|nr:hypothetical protein [Micromonospora thermarum]NJP33704.1 hypothetical protein [Micromonospora thermarum]